MSDEIFHEPTYVPPCLDIEGDMRKIRESLSGIVLYKQELELLRKFLNETDSSGLTPLMDAARYGNVDIVRVLLRIGVDVNIEDYCGMTALDYAKDSMKREFEEKSKMEKIIQMLIEAGA